MRKRLNPISESQSTPQPPKTDSEPPASPSEGKTDGRAKEPKKPKQGRALSLRDPEPWPEPVVGLDLAKEIQETFLRFLALPEGASVILTLWVLHAHGHDAATASPLLALISPQKRCGKTTTLSLLQQLVPRPLLASHTTTAALFRAIEMSYPTLLVDEADTFLRGNEDLRGLLNSGHTRTGSFLRVVGDDFEPRTFSTWAPKAIALIGTPPATLEDRSLVVTLRRKTQDEHVERLRLNGVDGFEHLRRQAWTWSRSNLAALRSADPGTPIELNDRAADNWRPLLAIADRIGESWPRVAREVAVRLEKDADEGDSAPALLLLGDLRDHFDAIGAERLTTTEILLHLDDLTERPWKDWKFGKALSPVQMAKMLKPYGAVPRAIRTDTGTLRGYYREDLEDAFSRYLPSNLQQAQQTNEDAASSENESCNRRPSVAPRESSFRPLGTRSVARVAGWELVEDKDEGGPDGF